MLILITLTAAQKKMVGHIVSNTHIPVIFSLYFIAYVPYKKV